MIAYLLIYSFIYRGRFHTRHTEGAELTKIRTHVFNTLVIEGDKSALYLPGAVVDRLKLIPS